MYTINSKEPRSIKDIVSDFVDDRHLHKYFDLEKLKIDWHIIVGDAFAAKISIHSLKEGTLRLKTNSSVVRYEVSIRKQYFIDKINLHFKKELIKDISI